jgi:hypothetical protein
MRYLLLVFDDPVALGRLPDAERGRIPADYRAFTASIVEGGRAVEVRPVLRADASQSS